MRMVKLLQHGSLFLVLNLIICFLGIYCYSKLKIKLIPELPVSSIYVTITNPGVKAGLIEKQITKPMEDILSTVDGLDSISSFSEISESKIELNLKPGISIKTAVTDVRDIISKNKSILPEGTKEPIVSTDSFLSKPMIYVSLYSDNGKEISNYQIIDIKQKLKYVDGYSKALVFGNKEQILYVSALIDRIFKYNISADQLMADLSIANSNFSGGKVFNNYKTEYISFNKFVDFVKDFDNIEIDSNGVAVKLKNIAKIELKDKEESSFAYGNEKKIILLGLFAKNGFNPVDFSKNINKFIEDYSKTNNNIKFEILIDDSKDVLKAFNDTTHTLKEAIILVSVIVYLLIGSLRYSSIAILAIPVSLSGSFIALYLFGYTINNVTMLAMILAIGLVVDDSIVVIENAEHYYNKGKNVFESIVNAMSNLFVSVLVLMLTLAVIYIPCIFMEGEIGRILQEFALTIVSSMIISFLVAFTLTPVLFVRLAKRTKHNFIIRYINWLLDLFIKVYVKTLSRVIRKPLLFITIIFVITLGGFYLAKTKLKIEVEPFEKKDMIILENIFSPNTSLKYIHTYMQKIFNTIKSDDNIQSSLILEESPVSTIWLTLKDRSRAEETLNNINDKLTKITVGGDVFVKIAQSKNAGSASGNYELDFYINNPKSPKNIQTASSILNEKMENTFDDFYTISPGIVQDIGINCNRDKLFKYGLTQKDFADILDIFLNQRKIEVFEDGHNTYDIVFRVDDNASKDLTKIESISIKNQKDGGSNVQLREVCNIFKSSAPSSIFRFNEQFSLNAHAITKPNVDLNQAINFIKKINDNLPDGSNISYSTKTKTLIELSQFFSLFIVVAVVGLYLLMYARFNSFIMPIIVLGSIPICLSFSLWGLYFTLGSFNIYTTLSLVTLMGLMTKHCLLLCSAIDGYQKSGFNLIKAIISGSKSRVRAIMITSLAMTIGLISLFFDNGNYANSRFQIATVLVIGIVFGSILVLYSSPILYFLLNKNKHSAQK
ncbi:efflux RND transporter permease subunit [Francisella philomiragia]|uniref:efflux RND transporter permease subunit n=1 Tax=Francisella philomiragia TaxID=28110 RepID=UPI001908509B|nr:efflux RND transporter permease subunit [Francisella philomiragia]MBK2025363.1 efflux RND transporter permease subunit [Francisella philomiragia]